MSKKLKIVVDRIKHNTSRWMNSGFFLGFILITNIGMISNPKSILNINEDWSPITHVPSAVATRWTKILPDSSNHLQAFWAAANQDDSSNPYQAEYHSILHSSSDEGFAWSVPIDILYDNHSIDGLSATRVGDTFHIFWNSDCLHHSQAHLRDIDRPRVWMEAKKCVAPRANIDSLHAITDKNNNTIHLTYSTGSELKYLFSQDNGKSWSFPGLVSGSLRSTEGSTFINPILAVSPNGTLYIVWTVLGSRSLNDSRPFGVYFTRSLDGGKTWLSPPPIAEGNEGQASIIASNDGLVHVIWNSSVGVSKRFHRWSDDGGISWSNKEEVLSGVQAGFTGPPGLATGTNDTAIALLGTDSGVRFTSWEQGNWASPVDLGSLADGETWTTDIVLISEDRICAYWNAYKAQTAGFSVTCKGEFPVDFTENANDPTIEIGTPPIQALSANYTQEINSPTPHPNKLETIVPVNSSMSVNLSTSSTFPLIVSVGLVFLVMLLVFFIRTKRL